MSGESRAEATAVLMSSMSACVRPAESLFISSCTVMVMPGGTPSCPSSRWAAERTGTLTPSDPCRLAMVPPVVMRVMWYFEVIALPVRTCLPVRQDYVSVAHVTRERQVRPGLLTAYESVAHTRRSVSQLDRFCRGYRVGAAQSASNNSR